MHPYDIIAAIKKRGYSQRRLATELDCCIQHINNVIHRGEASRRVASRIAAVTGMSLNTLWPGKYRPERVIHRRAA